jgi:hypothetical protein
MPIAEITEVRRAIGQVKQCVGELRARYGDIPAVRRLANDVERLDIDTADFRTDADTPSPRQPAVSEHEVVVVPDTPYDREMWRADGEYVRHDD